MAAGGRSLGAIRAVHCKQKDPPNASAPADFAKEACRPKKEPQAIYALGVWKSVASKSGFFGWAAGVVGWGAAQLGLVSGI
jgi:hypothetical protein